MVKKKIEKKSKKSHEDIEKKVSRKEQIRQENKILKGLFTIVGLIILSIFLIVFISNQSKSFDYNGVNFEIVEFCDAGPPCLVTYRTTIPVVFDGEDYHLTTDDKKTHDYNFYLRNDPRELENEVRFEGDLRIKNTLVFNSTSDFVCGGYGAIAAENLIKLYTISGINVVKDPNATCDTGGRYMLFNIQESDETSVDEIGDSCYNININDCEIVEGTERVMVDTFIFIDRLLE